MRQLFEIHFLNHIVRSKSIFEHIINNTNNDIDTLTYFNFYALSSMIGAYFHRVVNIK